MKGELPPGEPHPAAYSLKRWIARHLRRPGSAHPAPVPTTPPNVAKLTAPPEPGTDYFVPCLDYGGLWMPVIGRPHVDPELGQTTLRHWHADIRFMSDEDMRLAGHDPARVIPMQSYSPGQDPGFDIITFVAGRGQAVRKMVRRCRRAMPDYSTNRKLPCGSIYQWFSGKSLDHFGQLEDSMGDAGLAGCRTCPHRGTPLSSTRAIRGKITCPAHGLDFDEVTGKLVRRTEKVGDVYRYRRDGK